jgi:hypothetical protein
MAGIASIDDALRDARLFRGGRTMAMPRIGLPTDTPALDAALPWGGFPRGALSELLHASDGIGELSLLLPALRQLMQSERVALIAPPYLPYAPGLAQAGLPLAQLVWVTPSPDRALWTAEQCLRAGCLGGVLLWSNTGDDRALRRLQLAAEQGDTHAWLFRPLKHAANASPAALRLRVERERVEVMKCRGAVLRGAFDRGAAAFVGQAQASPEHAGFPQQAHASPERIAFPPQAHDKSERTALPPPPLAGEGRGGGDYGARSTAPVQSSSSQGLVLVHDRSSAHHQRITAPDRPHPSPPPQAEEGAKSGEFDASGHIATAAAVGHVIHSTVENITHPAAVGHVTSCLKQAHASSERPDFAQQAHASLARPAFPPPPPAGEGRGGGDYGARSTAPVAASVGRRTTRVADLAGTQLLLLPASTPLLNNSSAATGAQRRD